MYKILLVKILILVQVVLFREFIDDSDLISSMFDTTDIGIAGPD